MNGSQQIEYHRAALLRLLAGLFDLLGILPGGAPLARVPRPIRSMILRVLLPAESATKRLIVYLSRRLSLPLNHDLSGVARKAVATRKRNGVRAPSFWLFDRRKFFPELADKSKAVRRGPGPRAIDLYNWHRSVEPEPKDPEPPRDPDDGTRLCRRMLALHLALQDMEAQAMRLLKIMEKRAKAPPGPGSRGPLRPGPPPGRRETATHEIDEILNACHAMEFHDKPPKRDSS